MRWARQCNTRCPDSLSTPPCLSPWVLSPDLSACFLPGFSAAGQAIHHCPGIGPLLSLRSGWSGGYTHPLPTRKAFKSTPECGCSAFAPCPHRIGLTPKKLGSGFVPLLWLIVRDSPQGERCELGKGASVMVACGCHRTCLSILILLILKPHVSFSSYDECLLGLYYNSGGSDGTQLTVILTKWLLVVPSPPGLSSMRGIAFQRCTILPCKHGLAPELQGPAVWVSHQSFFSHHWSLQHHGICQIVFPTGRKRPPRHCTCFFVFFFFFWLWGAWHNKLPFTLDWMPWQAPHH